MEIPVWLQPLNENLSLVEVIREINAERERELAIHQAPSLRWPDIQDSSTEKAEPFLTV